MLSLDNLKLNERAIIKAIDSEQSIKTRLYDMGLNIGEQIQCVLISPSKLIKAYLVKNTLIAIRCSDAQKILVGGVNEENSFNR